MMIALFACVCEISGRVACDCDVIKLRGGVEGGRGALEYGDFKICVFPCFQLLPMSRCLCVCFIHDISFFFKSICVVVGGGCRIA